MIFTTTSVTTNNRTILPVTTAMIFVRDELGWPGAGSTSGLLLCGRWMELRRPVKNWDNLEAALGRGLACVADGARPGKVPGAFVDGLVGGNPMGGGAAWPRLVADAPWGVKSRVALGGWVLLATAGFGGLGLGVSIGLGRPRLFASERNSSSAG